MQKDGILFDLDGTLWDAAARVVESWNLTLRHFPEVGPITEAQMKGVMGKTLPKIGEALVTGVPVARAHEIVARCCDEENAYLERTGGTLYPGLEETLATLSARWPLYVVSNCQEGYIEAFYAAHGLGHYFAGSENAGHTGLPKWDNISLVARREGLSRVLYVGDTEMDCDAAHRAVVPFIHARYGFGRAPEADYTIDALAELPALVARIWA